MPDTTPFHLPLGDALLAQAEVRFHVTDKVAATWVGGPSGWVPGLLHLTRQHLCFRPLLGQPHPQERDVPLESVRAVRAASKRWLGFIPGPGKDLQVMVAWAGGEVEHRYALPDAPAFAAKVQAALDDYGPPPPPDARVDQALAEGVTERGAYTRTLLELSFPQAYWHPEDVEELREIVHEIMGFLGVDALVDRQVWEEMDLEVEIPWGPEDYEVAENSEHAERLEQIRRVMHATNAALPQGAPKRFFEFVSDLPRWGFHEPCWLWLTPAQREGLVGLGVLRPVGDEGA